MTKPNKTTGNPNKNLRVNKFSILNKLPNTWLLLIFISLVAASIWVNLKYPRIKTTDKTQGSSFTGGSVENPLKLPTSEEIISLNQINNSIAKVPLASLGNIKISFLYQCSEKCPQLSLNLATNSETIGSNLFYHPILDRLTWFYYRQDPLIIFQKHTTQANLEELLANNPDKIIVEESIAHALDWPKQKLTFLENIDQIDTQEYLITTMEPYEKIGPWFKYQLEINTSSLELNPQEEIIFSITQPEATPTATIQLAHFKIEKVITEE